MDLIPKISIVICTYNNAHSLKMTLTDIANCKIYETDIVELLCIDNNSSDETKDVFYEIFPSFNFKASYHFENKQGLSNARNLGLNRASGDYVLFTDDDAIIPTGWINKYLCIIKQKTPDCLYSKISVIWDKPKPWWYVKEYAPFFVHLDYGDKIISVKDYDHEFFGKNFCLNKKLLISLGGFDPKLGRCGNRLISGEETLIYKKLIQRKHTVIYFPDAEIGHRLKEREYSYGNIKKIINDSSYSSYHLAKSLPGRKVIRRPLYLLKENLVSVPLSLIKMIFYALCFNIKMSLYHYLQFRKNIKTILLWSIDP
jgi:glucosyl-dolichyl phosphate glucuronosyltransferase